MNIFWILVVIVLISFFVDFLTFDYDMEGLKYSWHTYKYFRLIADKKKVSVRTVRTLSEINRITHIVPWVTFGVTALIAFLMVPFGTEELSPASMNVPEIRELVERQNNDKSFYISRKNNFFEILYINDDNKVVIEKVPIEYCSIVNDSKNYVVIKERKSNVQLKWLIFKSFKRKRVEKLYEIHTNASIYNQQAGL